MPWAKEQTAANAPSSSAPRNVGSIVASTSASNYSFVRISGAIV